MPVASPRDLCGCGFERAKWRFSKIFGHPCSTLVQSHIRPQIRAPHETNFCGVEINWSICLAPGRTAINMHSSLTLCTPACGAGSRGASTPRSACSPSGSPWRVGRSRRGLELMREAPKGEGNRCLVICSSSRRQAKGMEGKGRDATWVTGRLPSTPRVAAIFSSIARVITPTTMPTGTHPTLPPPTLSSPRNALEGQVGAKEGDHELADVTHAQGGQDVLPHLGRCSGCEGHERRVWEAGRPYQAQLLVVWPEVWGGGGGEDSRRDGRSVSVGCKLWQDHCRLML